MSTKQAPPPIKAKPKPRPAVKPKPSKPTASSTSELTVVVLPTSTPPLSPSPAPLLARQPIFEPSSSQPLHSAQPDHELYGNVASSTDDAAAAAVAVAVDSHASPEVPAARAPSAAAVMATPDHADQPAHELYGNLSPAAPEANTSEMSHSDESVEPVVPPPLQPRSRAAVEHTYVNTVPTGRPAAVEENDDTDDSNDIKAPAPAVAEIAAETVLPVPRPVTQHLKTLCEDLSFIVEGNQTRVRQGSLAGSVASALRKQARQPRQLETEVEASLEEEVPDTLATDEAEAVDELGPLKRSRPTTLKRLGQALSVRRKPQLKMPMVKPQETAEAPDIIAAVSEAKRLELMMQVKAGSLTVAQMEAQLLYLAQQAAPAPSEADALATLQENRKGRKSKKGKPKGLEPRQLRALMAMVSKGLITQEQMAEEVARLLLATKPNIPSTPNPAPSEEMYGAPVQISNPSDAATAPMEASNLYGVKVQTAPPHSAAETVTPPTASATGQEEIYEDTPSLGPAKPISATTPAPPCVASNSRVPASIRGRKPAPLPQGNTAVSSMPEPLAIIDTTHPMQQTTTSERVDDVYATTDEALYGQSTTAELSPDAIAAVPQAERLQLMLQVKAGTLTLRQMHCLLLTKAQSHIRPSLPDRPANMSMRRGQLATPPSTESIAQAPMPTPTPLAETDLVYDDAPSGPDYAEELYSDASGMTYKPDLQAPAGARPSRPPSLQPRNDDDIDDRWRHAAVPANPPKYQPPSEPAPVKASPPSEPPPTRLYANAEAVAAVARGSMVVPTIDDMEEYSTLPPHNLPACDVLAPDDLYSDLRTEMQGKTATDLSSASEAQFDDALADALALISMVAQEASNLALPADEDATPTTLAEFRASLVDPELDTTLLALQDM